MEDGTWLTNSSATLNSLLTTLAMSELQFNNASQASSSMVLSTKQQSALAKVMEVHNQTNDALQTCMQRIKAMQHEIDSHESFNAIQEQDRQRFAKQYNETLAEGRALKAQYDNLAQSFQEIGSEATLMASQLSNAKHEISEAKYEVTELRSAINYKQQCIDKAESMTQTAIEAEQ